MSRPLTTLALQELYKRNTDEVLLFLLKLDHADWATPIYLVNNTEDIISNGDTYTAFPFQITLPVEDADQVQAASVLEICNVSREILTLMRSVSSPISAEVSVILASAPNDLLLGPMQFEIKGPSWTPEAITAQMVLEPLLQSPIPAHRFTPNDYPGL